MSLTRTKYLYFATGSGANASGEASYYPVTSFLGFDPASSVALDLYFQSLHGEQAYDKIRLTIAANTHKIVMDDVLRAINTFDSHNTTWSQDLSPNVLESVYDQMDWKMMFF